MASGTEVAKVEQGSNLPGLYQPVTSTRDLQISGVYLIADMSEMARSRVAEPGDVVLALGADDIDPTFLIKQDGSVGPTFRAYIIARDSFVASTADSTMTFLPKDYVRQPDETDVWNGYFYYLSLPDVDPALPARMMLWRTAGSPVARKINTYLARMEVQGNTNPLHVEFGVESAIGQKSRKQYWKLTVKQIPVDEETLPIALRQAELIAASQAQFQTDVAPDPDAASY